MKNTHGGVLLLVKVHGKVCNFTKSNTPPWVFLNFANNIKSRNASQLIVKVFIDFAQHVG